MFGTLQFMIKHSIMFFFVLRPVHIRNMTGLQVDRVSSHFFNCYVFSHQYPPVGIFGVTPRSDVTTQYGLVESVVVCSTLFSILFGAPTFYMPNSIPKNSLYEKQFTCKNQRTTLGVWIVWQDFHILCINIHDQSCLQFWPKVGIVKWSYNDFI